MNSVIKVLIAMAICTFLLSLVWFYGVVPQLKPVWTEKGTIMSITRGEDNYISDWHFVVNTATHGTVSPVLSQCGYYQLVGNTIYVSKLTDGVYSQTDASGNICTEGY